MGGRRSTVKSNPGVIENYRKFVKVRAIEAWHDEDPDLEDEILLQRIEVMAKGQLNSLGLKEPFPSSPSRPPKYVIYTSDGVHNFCELYAAKHAFDLLLRGEDYQWADDNRIVLDSGRFIRSSDLELIVEYDFKPAEAEWVVPEPYYSSYTGTHRVVQAPAEAPKKRTRKERTSKRDRSSTPRPSTSGLVTIGEIAAELKIEPRIARGVLRASKTPKPDFGWAWTKDEAKKIASLVASGIKK